MGLIAPPLAIVGVIARLTSFDTGDQVVFSRANEQAPPSEHDRNFSAEWQEAGVAQASPNPLEYMHSKSEERVYKCYFDAYDPYGVSGTIEPTYLTLKKLTRRVEGKVRAHYCAWSQGQQRFRCVVESVSFPVKRVNTGGGALIAYEVQITLKEIK
jgi:hypothetical protein